MARSVRRKNNHHLVWPRRNYDKGIAKQFRNLPCFQVDIDVEVHAFLHVIYAPPKHVDVSEMLYFIRRHDRRDCGCYEPEKRTSASAANVANRKEGANAGKVVRIA